MNIKYFYLSVLVFSFLFLTSCKVTKETQYRQHNTGESITTTKRIGQNDISVIRAEWQYKFITETGAAPILEKYPEQSRNIMLAKRGAMLDAQRKLAEKINTIRLTSTTTMADYSTSDFVQSRISASLRNIEVISESINESTNVYEVTIQMPKLVLLNIIEEHSR